MRYNVKLFQEEENGLMYGIEKVNIVIFYSPSSGRQYDGLGKLSDWWDETTAKNFITTTKCMNEQYSSMKVRGVKVRGRHYDGNFV